MLPNWLTALFSILSPVLSVLTFYLKVKSERVKDEKERKELRLKETGDIKRSISVGFEKVDQTIADLQKDFSQKLYELHTTHEKDVSDLRLEFEKQYQLIFEKVDERRRKDTKDLHNRIDEFQSGFASDVMERIGKLEGSVTSKIESVENIMNIIQAHLIENGGK